MSFFLCRSEVDGIRSVSTPGPKPLLAAQSRNSPAYQRLQRFVTIGYIAVDAFLILTGFLFGLQALKSSWAERGRRLKSSNEDAEPSVRSTRTADCCCSRHRMGWYRRFVRIMPPMMLAIAVHCAFLFRNGLYPLGVVRSEARLDLQRFDSQPFSAGTAALNASADDDTFGMCNNGCGAWWANLFQLQVLIPFGGVMIHTWTVATQYLFYLTFPLITRNWDISRKATLPLFCLSVLGFSAALKLVGFVHVSGMAHNTIVRGVLAFFWYAFPGARIGVVYAGVALAWLLHGWESGSRPRVRAAVDWALGPSPGGVALRSAAWVLVGTYVHFADADFGSSQSALLATLLHVGSVGSAAAWAWVVVLAVTGTPVLGTKFGDESAVLNTSVKAGVELSPPSSSLTPPSSPLRPRLRSRSVSDFVQLPARGLSGAEVQSKTQASTHAPQREGQRKAVRGGSAFSVLLAWKGFKPLARLSYLTYLTHCMVMVFCFSSPERLMPHSQMPLPAPRPLLKQNTVTAASIGFWINGTWPEHGETAEYGAAAWQNLDHAAIASKWLSSRPEASAQSVLPSKNTGSPSRSEVVTPQAASTTAPKAKTPPSAPPPRAAGRTLTHRPDSRACPPRLRLCKDTWRNGNTQRGPRFNREHELQALESSGQALQS